MRSSARTSFPDDTGQLRILFGIACGCFQAVPTLLAPRIHRALLAGRGRCTGDHTRQVRRQDTNM